MCPTEAQPIEDLWESVGSFSRTCQNVFQLRGQKDESLSTNCQSVVGGGLLLRAITLPYLPCAAPWVEQRPRGQQPAVIAVCCLQCAEVSAEGMPEFASDAVLWEDVGERGNGRRRPLHSNHFAHSSSNWKAKLPVRCFPGFEEGISVSLSRMSFQLCKCGD